MKKNWKETLKLWLGALLLLAESAAIGCKKLPKKAVALCVAAALVVAMVPAYIFAAETTYDIWVGGVQVTSANKDNIVVPGAIGSATYDPDTQTLTPNNFSYTGEGYNFAGNVYALIYSQDIDLKIVLKGTNTLAGADMYQEGIIIENGSLTFTDSDADDVTGSLKLTAGYPVIFLDDGSLSVENVNLTVINTQSPTGNPGDAIFVNGNILIINSDVTAISGDSDGDDIPEEGATFGIMTTGSISVANSTVSAIGYAVGIWAGSLSVANSTVTAAGNLHAMGYINTEEGLVPNLTGDYVVYAGDDAASATKADAPTDDTYASKYVKIEPVKYDLWVGGVQVTSANKDNIVVPGAIGSATYDPDTQTLTLNNFSYTGLGYNHYYYYDEDYGEHYYSYAAIYSKNKLIIKLVGNNTVFCEGEGAGLPSFCGVFTEEYGDLTICDDTTDNAIGSFSANRISCYGNLTIRDVNVTAQYRLNALYSAGDLWIRNATVIATAESGAITCYGDITMEDSIVTATSTNTGEYDRGIFHRDTLTVKNSIVEMIGGKASESLSASTLIPTLEFDIPFVVLAGADKASAVTADSSVDATYTGKYVKITPIYKVTFDYGSFGNETVTVIHGECIEPATPVFAGKVLVGWYTDSSFATAFDFDTPITANKTVYAKFADYEGDKAELQDAIDALEADVTQLNKLTENGGTIDQINAKISAIECQIAALDALKNKYAEADATLKQQLQEADAAINAAIAALTTRVQDLEADLAAAKSDISANASTVAQLTTNLAALNASLTDLSNKLTNDYATKAELTSAINSAKDTINSAIDALTVRVQYLEADLAAAKSDISTNTSKVAQLTAELAALNASLTDLSNKLTNDYATKAELTSAINSAKATINNAIDALTTRVQDLEADLAAAKNNISTNTSKVAELTTDLAALNASLTDLSNTLTDDYATKAELTSAINSAKNTINSAIAALTTRVQNLEAGLAEANSKIDTNTSDVTTLKSDVTTLNAWKNEAQSAIAALQTLTGTQGTDISRLQVAVQDLEAELAAAEARIDDLEDRIATLEGKISALEVAKQNLDAAVAALNAAIANKADTATLNQKVTDLIAAIATAEATTKAYTDSAVTTLNAAIITAKDEAVGAAKDLVDAAKAQLQAAIDNKADTAAVNAAIANLQNAITALQNAKDNYIAADAALKAELEEKIAKAKQEAIDAAKGHIPYIGTNGNWWIGDTDTGVDANGIKGDTGNGIASITTKKENGVTTVTITFTDPEKDPVVFTISDGETGATGADGVGITKIEKTATDGNVDTYTVTLTNGKTYTFTVTNGKDGADGKDGENGIDGLTPFIGENGNWWIGDTDTGVKAVAEQTAQKGTDTITVVSIVVASVALLSNLVLVVWIVTKKKKVLV